MENVNDSEINLGLALGTANQYVESCSNTGAGANAKSSLRIDTKTFVRPRPLTELVWSRQNGLSIKCAGCSRCRDVGPSQMGISPPHDTIDDKNVIEGHPVGSRETCHVDSVKFPEAPGPFFGSSLGHTDENADEVKCVHFIEIENSSKGKEKESMAGSKSILVGNVAGTSEGPHNQRTVNLLPLLTNEPQMLESKAENLSDDRLGLNIGFPLKVQEMTQIACQERPLPAQVQRVEDNMKEEGSSSAHFLEKIEEIAENDMQNLIVKDVILENLERDLVPGEVSSSDSRMRVQNREESCQGGNERDDGNSHGSMESCNSANLLSKVNKRWRFEQQLIIGSKRLKKQSQECPVSAPVVKQESSFMNWISNMVKGVKPCQEEDHSLALSVGHPINDDEKIGTCDKNLNLGSKNLGFQTVFQSLYSHDAKRVETRTQIETKSIADSKEIVLFDKTASNQAPDDVSNQKAFGNLWIARLSPKPPSNLLSSDNSDLKSFVARDSSAATHSKKSCLFCGITGHELHDCLQINEKELAGFLKNISLYEAVTREAPCLCIKCFQLNHWASACPSKRCYSMIKTKDSWYDLNFNLTENRNVFFNKKMSNLDEIPKHFASSSGKNKQSEEKLLRMPREIFDTIRRLRLSRTDILKWMNSRLPVSSLDGYFLRLRLAKWEEGVGGAGYYVACITDENPSEGSKKGIRVNIRGVECLVESRYISNCDFLQEELVGWWETSRQLPMAEELTSKLEERKRLGF